jgi:hypothetical protein
LFPLKVQYFCDFLKKGKSGFHNYVINDNNVFNLINNELSELEKIVDSMSDHYWVQMTGEIKERFLIDIYF